MPDAEPRAGTTSAAEPGPLGSEIVDLTDTALDDATAAERGDGPDAATPTDRVPPADVAMLTDRRERRMDLLRLACAQLDLGWIEHAHPIAFALGGLAVLGELDEERLAGAERLDDRAHIAAAQGEARARLRQGIAPLAFPLVHLPPQPRRRHCRHEVRRITHLSTPFPWSFAPLPSLAGLAPDPLLVAFAAPTFPSASPIVHRSSHATAR